MLVGRTLEKLAHVAGEIEQRTGNADLAAVHIADVADAVQARAMVTFTINRFGSLDALVNNAGSAALTPIADHSPGHVEQVFAANALGPINAIAAALPALRDAPDGVVVNVSSMAAHDPFPGLGVYGAAKASTEAICGAIRNEEPSVRAYAIAPGAVETPLLRSIVSEADLPTAATLDPDTVAAEIVACVTGATDLDPGATRVMASP
ncbi:MAG: short-chain dehydrogenase [Phycisphaeraceae bacterium]|nr:MAG: short-chain dehydrogenase [Phycisphaeraceae bacterium]